MKNPWLSEVERFCSWHTFRVGLRTHPVPQLSVVLPCSTVVSKDLVEGEVQPQVCQVTWQVVHLVCGHFGNKWDHPLVRMSPTCAYRAIPYSVAESGLWAFLVCTSFLVQSLAHMRHTTDISLKTLKCHQGVKERAGPATRLIHWCRRQLLHSAGSTLLTGLLLANSRGLISCIQGQDGELFSYLTRWE